MRPTPRIAGILVALAVAAGGLGPSAALGQAAPAPPPAPKFERIEDSPYLVLYWNCKRSESGALLLEGLAEVPYRTATNITHGELTLVGLDAKGQRVSQAIGYLPPVIYMTYSAPFSVMLPLSGTETRVDLFYAYDYSGNRGGEGQKFMRRHWSVIPVSNASFIWSVPGACPVP